MKINKQLFEDVLSSKLKGTFVLNNGFTVKSNRLYNTGKSDTDYIYGLKGIINYAYNNKGTLTPYYRYCNDYQIVNFIPDTDMKENELTIEIPDGKIVDWDKSKKQNKVVLKNKQLTYEDICEKLLSERSYFITNESTIHPTFEKNQIFASNCAFTQHQLVCILAKNKLANVAKYLNDGWKPSLNEHVWYLADSNYDSIYACNAQFGEYYCSSRILFKKEILAKQAIEILGEETVKLALEPLGI